MKKQETLIIRVEPKMKKSLKNLAKQDRRVFSDYVRIILEDAVKQKEVKQ